MLSIDYNAINRYPGRSNTKSGTPHSGLFPKLPFFVYLFLNFDLILVYVHMCK